MESKDLYKFAYESHYRKNNFEKAKVLYNKVIEEFPSSIETGYARTQLINLEKDSQKIKLVSEIHDFSINSIQLTTAQNLEGYRVIETLEIITSECVIGMDIIEDFITSFTDFFGGRSKTTQNSLSEARKTCLYELKREAYDLGANAVIAVDLKYSQFTGKGKSMLFVVASGTAVVVEKIEAQNNNNLTDII